MSFPSGKVLVIGATGKVGQAVVKLLQSRGIPVRVFVRNLSSVTTADRVGSAAAATDFFTDTAGRAPLVVNDSQVEVCEGDVANCEAVSRAIEGVVAVIDVHGVAPLRFSKLSDMWSDPLADPSHPASVNFKGVQHIVAACQTHGVNHLVRLTGMSVSMKASSPLVWLFCVLLSWTVKWHRRAEMLIRESGLNYTVVQPSGLKDFAAAHERGDLLLLECEADSVLPALPPATGISRADVASLCVEVLEHSGCKKATVRCVSLPADKQVPPGLESASDWSQLVTSVKPDTHALTDQNYVAYSLVGFTLAGAVLSALCYGTTRLLWTIGCAACR